MAARSTTGKRLGRPPASDSGDTRRRILDIARAAFAAGGYDASTNRELAADAGITAGALYHYFGSKLDLYVAVHDDMQARIYDLFAEAAAATPYFVGKFEAILDTAHVMNKQDPTLAAFLGAVRADMRRHPEIRAQLGEHAAQRDAFFVSLVDAGVTSGEITKTNRKFMIEFVTTILTGLTDGVSDDVQQHKRAITSIKMMLRGELLSKPTR